MESATRDELTTAIAGDLTPARRREEVLTLTTVVDLPQDELWRRLVDPTELARWSPVVPEHPFDAVGPNSSRENPGDEAVDAEVTESRAPWYLEHHWGDDTLGWQLAPAGEGTQLNLVHQLSDRGQLLEMAAGWHVCLTVLRLQARGIDVSRCVGPDALAHGWAEVVERYREALPVPEAERDGDPACCGKP